MYETATCRHCHKTISVGHDGHWRPVGGAPSSITRYCPTSERGAVVYHLPTTGTDADPRPDGPYVLHLGLHFFADDAEPIPADTLGPDFHTDGDSWNQWREPFDGSQRVAVRLDAMPDDPDAHAEEAVLALRALLGIRGVTGVRTGDYASYTMDDDRDQSEWEVVVKTCHV